MRVKTLLTLGCAVAALAGCATQPLTTERGEPDEGAPGVRPAPAGEAPTVAPLPAPPRGTNDDASSEVAFMALSLVGTRYANGGGSPQVGFDCSGLVVYVYAHALQLSLPRNTVDLARKGAAVKRVNLRPGDLVFYNTLQRPYSHVGIYLGESRFVHAPSSGGAVRVEDMQVAYWAKRYNGARRVMQ